MFLVEPTHRTQTSPPHSCVWSALEAHVSQDWNSKERGEEGREEMRQGKGRGAEGREHERGFVHHPIPSP